MKQVSYRDVPSTKQFQSDSSIAFAVRAEDVILVHLDWLLERYHWHTDKRKDWSLNRIILCEIFLSANFWIKSCKERNPRMKPERYPAVLALFEVAVTKLCMVFGCSLPQVPLRIEEMFGRDLTQKGASTDVSQKAHRLTEKMLAQSRIRFKGGRAWHYGLDPKDPLRLELLSTKDFFIKLHRPGGAVTNDDWAAFIMTHEREFYMTKHFLNQTDKANIFHSSYTNGRSVAMAGTMLVEGGVIKGIRPDSGHYMPHDHNMAGALLALQMFAVPMDQVVVQDYLGEPLGTAKEFMKTNLKWGALKLGVQKRRHPGVDMAGVLPNLPFVGAQGRVAPPPPIAVPVAPPVAPGVATDSGYNYNV